MDYRQMNFKKFRIMIPSKVMRRRLPKAALVTVVLTVWAPVGQRLERGAQFCNTQPCFATQM